MTVKACLAVILKGGCDLGDECEYWESHSLSLEELYEIAQCVYYQDGMCHQPKKCKWLHGEFYRGCHVSEYGGSKETFHEVTNTPQKTGTRGRHQKQPPAKFSDEMLDTKPCLDLARLGHCRRGDDCIFAASHYWPRARLLQKSVCKSPYIASCRYGEKCLFVHKDQKTYKSKQQATPIHERMIESANTSANDSADIENSREAQNRVVDEIRQNKQRVAANQDLQSNQVSYSKIAMNGVFGDDPVAGKYAELAQEAFEAKDYTAAVALFDLAIQRLSAADNFGDILFKKCWSQYQILLGKEEVEFEEGFARIKSECEQLLEADPEHTKGLQLKTLLDLRTGDLRNVIDQLTLSLTIEVRPSIYVGPTSTSLRANGFPTDTNIGGSATSLSSRSRSSAGGASAAPKADSLSTSGLGWD